MARIVLTFVCLLWALVPISFATEGEGEDKGKGKGGGGPVTTIHRDVAIVGGGAAGSYSAVRLREDFGVSVVVIEKDNKLGGHVNTWVDPATGRGFDAGVQNWIEINNASSFFERFGVAVQPNVRSVLDQHFIDFATGARLTNYTPPPTADRSAALKRYLAAAERFLPILEPGWWNFPQPSEIPSDLLLPFRDFAAKYNLTAALPQIFATTGFGKHNFMDSLTLFFMRSFDVSMARTLLGLEANFVPVSRRNQDLYDAILTFLGPDALTRSTVTDAKRWDGKRGVTLEVYNWATGATTRVIAKKLLFTVAPTEENLEPFNPNGDEKEAFSGLYYSSSVVGIVSHPSLPLQASLVNTPEAAQPANWAAAAPSSPFNTRFENYPNSTYYRVIAVGDQKFNKEQARDVIQSAFDRMVAAGTLQQTTPLQNLTFHLLEPHGPVSASASRLAVDTGIIQKLNGLQGKRSIWYTGAAWSVHLTTSLWRFTDTVLPKVVASL
ncbi:hypothetical protein CHGG_00322 [Chaetomium globosum CBS 148.51]|uniref:Amine oxidase domain-containing protein n=1 Tax=Chaetomium globosum (strain ATCC 6205 / CBS 148.51 / DSM 1962 / NBRC 6347 / NRRL 1970) TaxID=306901 RepID=Q2HHI2_CHAGB|nr:uncharacterized protein CHGG_00322 [Chaetomium globosum CBS 148.51]EAQ92087.1 hypothetical protein CHGG_00322 [Chaetomium globosum CBS 148.51]